MEEKLKKASSGTLICINDRQVNYRAEIYINEYYQGMIVLYHVSQKIVLFAEEEKIEYLVVDLENGEKITITGLHFRCASYREEGKFKLEMQGDFLFKSNVSYTNISKFQEIYFEITDGNEIIGLCPYEINENYENILLYQGIDIPIHIKNEVVELENGELTFCVFPEYQYSKKAFSIGFKHRITWRFNSAIDIREIQCNLDVIIDLFSVLAGESVTVNSLHCVENDNLIEVIGICNFPKDELNILRNEGIDYTSFKRGALYKITDFQNLKQGLNYWFTNYKKINNAQKAYRRILLDEEVHIVTVNKFLAAMQLIEGYAQAFENKEKEIQEFEKKKCELISKIENKEEQELIKNGLGFSGISFRKAVKDYLHKGYSCFKKISKTKFVEEKEKLINDIVNDRNYYTHSSNRMRATMEFDDLLNITDLCKELYRIISLKDMGLDTEIIKQRVRNNRRCYWLMENIMGIEFESEHPRFIKFDREMRYFSDSKEK